MTIQILAPATNVAWSPPLALAKGARIELVLVRGDGETLPAAGYVDVQFARESGDWATVAGLSANVPRLLVEGPVSMRVGRRGETSAPLGVEYLDLAAAGGGSSTGGATEATLGTRASEATLAALSARVPALSNGRTPVDGSGVTQPISAAALPLPTGAATETTLAALSAKTPALVNGRQPVDGSAVTQPVSAAALPLPTGAATEATLATRATEASLLTRATEATLALIRTAIGSQSDASNLNVSQDGSVITWLKGCITYLGTLSSKLDRLPATLGIKTSALSMSVAPASDANVARETYSVTSVVATTSGTTGTNFVGFTPVTACTAIEIVNTEPGAVDIEYYRGSGSAINIPAGYSRLVDGITSTSQITVRRKDAANTAVTVKAEARAVA